jgi:hypothetical protein
MTPQDTRSPFQQQRWLELYNAGTELIPAFGVCQIISPGSSRPESSGYTPTGGRTVLHVGKPTSQLACLNAALTVVNGPCPIPVYETGRVGTMDSPMLALVGSSSYATGLEVGVKAGSFALWSGYTGYVIVGDYDAGTGTMRVVKVPTTDDLVEGCLAETHPGYGTVFEIYLQHWVPESNGHAPDDPAVAVKAIDWRAGMVYPAAGARGLFKPRLGYCDGEYICIYEVVSMDCSVPTIDCTEAEVASCP